MRTPHAHPLARNHKTWTPHLVGAFDTEFTTGAPEPGQARTFRCAAAAVARRHGKARRGQVATCLTEDPEELIEWVVQAAEPGTPLWLYAHNAAVDVQVIGLLDGLLQRGWRLSRHGLANPSLWAILVKDRQSIHLCDSMSLFGCGLKQLGELLGRPKYPMPEIDDDVETWLEYCWRDVDVLMLALLSCMEDWERLDLGRWTDTGPGCGWNSLRHRMSGGQVWIIPDQDAQAFERSAIYGGRRELLAYGQWPEPEYVDLDLEHAHLSIASWFPLPMDRGPAFDGLPLDSSFNVAVSVGVIARCRVRCTSPRYPLRTPAGVIYPVGEFWTTLAGPEIRWALSRGELCEIGRGYTYRLGHWAGTWSRWVADVLEGRVEEAGPMLRQLLKGASKTVWGRTAMRVTGTVAEQDGPTEELRLERGHDQSRGCEFTIVDWGWRRRIEIQDQEGDDSFPAILAWIQSHLRVLVGRLVDQLGEDAVAMIASDGVLVAPWRLAELMDGDLYQARGGGGAVDVAEAALDALLPATRPLTLRVKDVLRRVRALGPETLESDQRRVVAGVPRKAVAVDAWTYQGEVWPSFVAMTQAPWSGAVLVAPRTWHCEGARPLRWVLEDGACEPLVAATTDGEGPTRVLPGPAATAHRGGRLRASQHPALERLLHGGQLLAVEGPGPAG